MPEGDTIFKLAAYLTPALTGKTLAGGQLRDLRNAELRGSTVSAVYARGKHLFIELEGQRLLRSHLGMWGSWHGYAPDETWQRPRSQASIILDVGERIYVCFNAKEVELLRKHGISARKFDIVLGPDLLDVRHDIATVIERVHRLTRDRDPIADILLNQRVAAGIGNVYKSETLHVEQINPKTPRHALSDSGLIDLYATAADLLAKNVRGGPRVTRQANDEAGILWVYGRTAQPCLRCDTPIVSLRFGRRQRSTFWCPRCQPEVAIA